MPMNRPLRYLAALTVAIALALSPSFVSAKAGSGSSMGSRGSRTYSAPPPTATAPGSIAPMERSMTPNAPRPGMAQPGVAAPARGGFFSGGGFFPGLMGGFLGAGLAGLLFGHGFFWGIGGLGSIFGLLIQIGLIVLLVRFALGFFRRPLGARPGSGNAESLGGHDDDGRVYARGTERYAPGGASYSSSSALNLTAADYDEIERLLGSIQSDWSKADLATLRRHVTPEMLSYFAEQLSANASRGVENRVAQVRLLQGDLAEAWAEGEVEYATVAMRFSLVDWTIETATGRTVAGDATRPVETTEIWTFVRARGGHWLLSAIQQTREHAIS
jgi:predicted lipid-binding transport protein (Tim44 family)